MSKPRSDHLWCKFVDDADSGVTDEVSDSDTEMKNMLVSSIVVEFLVE